MPFLLGGLLKTVSEPAFAETGKLAQKSAHKDIEPKQPKLRQFCRSSQTRSQSQKPAFALHKKNPRIGGTRGFLSTPLGVVPTSFYFGGVKMKKSWVGVVVRRG
ncbi:hypothetical protein Lpp228_10679 [Lacticaseibacillus paracasei subsp. paracasei Lpp228]|uniref:Uncharacterized protein n=5 Tax=Lacticaseibacillus paracasei TaxID=1597 RepID=Q03B83_LACP3|nr:hypothetical protein LSEI_0699 [Lacticaseibacillus paracasei ATCC 334]ALX89212.1 hypothetical protein AWC33_08455 [Lacticaseibacillus paracasei]AZP98104.1 hypothetical protein CYL78_04245 [Lacticaseibacillus paracasei subsp. tolerans]EPC47714.1 hypothetical protein Lpp229_03853 [Lacticaseibacillus paracasei subsp. paracasei Lpp229]EPC62830.1 hypothetical protein Lpp14_06425 [Lacticaseibacillus paracasei subsp. paracasei Lpp14]EPC64965.1 hypothetical protein Lpp228_10679 [Lacticaseibacillus 